jgi:hypothetical protein
MMALTTLKVTIPKMRIRRMQMSGILGATTLVRSPPRMIVSRIRKLFPAEEDDYLVVQLRRRNRSLAAHRPEGAAASRIRTMDRAGVAVEATAEVIAAVEAMAEVMVAAVAGGMVEVLVVAPGLHANTPVRSLAYGLHVIPEAKPTIISGGTCAFSAFAFWRSC